MNLTGRPKTPCALRSAMALLLVARGRRPASAAREVGLPGWRVSYDARALGWYVGRGGSTAGWTKRAPSLKPARAVQLHREGVSRADIAERLGCHVDTVTRNVRRWAQRQEAL